MSNPLSHGPSARRLLIFSTSNLDDVTRKGNVRYVRHYLAEFSSVIQCYFPRSNIKSSGDAQLSLVALSPFRNRYVTVLAAPFLLARAIRRNSVTNFLCADLVFGWWSGLGARLLGWPMCIVPVTLPEQIYATSGQSLSGLPIFIERRFIHWTLRGASGVIIGSNGIQLRLWLQDCGIPADRIVEMPLTVDELPTPDFYREVESNERHAPTDGAPFHLLYVGRLHPEKQTDDLPRILASVRELGYDARLQVIGDGPGRDSLKAECARLGVDDVVSVTGWLPATDVARAMLGAHVFVSPRTGTAMREACIAGLPTVAYAADWVLGVFDDGETALLVPEGDTDAMASAVAGVLSDYALWQRLSVNATSLARRLWNPELLPESLSVLDSVTRKRGVTL